MTLSEAAFVVDRIGGSVHTSRFLRPDMTEAISTDKTTKSARCLLLDPKSVASSNWLRFCDREYSIIEFGNFDHVLSLFSLGTAGNASIL